VGDFHDGKYCSSGIDGSIVGRLDAILAKNLVPELGLSWIVQRGVRPSSLGDIE